MRKVWKNTFRISRITSLGEYMIKVNPDRTLVKHLPKDLGEGILEETNMDIISGGVKPTCTRNSKQNNSKKPSIVPRVWTTN